MILVRANFAVYVVKNRSNSQPNPLELSNHERLLVQDTKHIILHHFLVESRGPETKILISGAPYSLRTLFDIVLDVLILL